MATVDPISEIQSPRVGLVAAAATEANTRVYVDANGKWAIAAPATPGIATTTQQAAAGAMLEAVLDSANWLKAGIASGAIVKGANVYEDATGKLTSSPAASGRFVGVAVSAAGADNDLFRYIAVAADPIRHMTAVSAGANVAIDTGFGANPAFYIYQVTRANADLAGTSITWAAGVGTVAGLNAGDVVMLSARRFTK